MFYSLRRLLGCGASSAVPSKRPFVFHLVLVPLLFVLPSFLAALRQRKMLVDSETAPVPPLARGGQFRGFSEAEYLLRMARDEVDFSVAMGNQTQSAHRVLLRSVISVDANMLFVRSGLFAQIAFQMVVRTVGHHDPERVPVGMCSRTLWFFGVCFSVLGAVMEAGSNMRATKVLELVPYDAANMLVGQQILGLSQTASFCWSMAALLVFLPGLVLMGRLVPSVIGRMGANCPSRRVAATAPLPSGRVAGDDVEVGPNEFEDMPPPELFVPVWDPVRSFGSILISLQMAVDACVHLLGIVAAGMLVAGFTSQGQGDAAYEAGMLMMSSALIGVGVLGALLHLVLLFFGSRGIWASRMRPPQDLAPNIAPGRHMLKVEDATSSSAMELQSYHESQAEQGFDDSPVGVNDDDEIETTQELPTTPALLSPQDRSFVDEGTEDEKDNWDEAHAMAEEAELDTE
jgi:hypothetical protein